MSAATPHGHAALLLRPGAVAPSGAGGVRPAASSSSAPASGSTAHGWGTWVAARRLRRLGLRAAAVVPRGDRRKRRRPVQRAHRRLVPLEHELVHLLGGDVLRRLLRRAVLGPRCIALPDARRPRATRCCGPTSRRSGRASAPGYTGSPAGIVEPFATMGPWPIPTINTALLLTSGVTLTIAHHALIAGQRAQDDRLHVDHGAARRHLPRLAGLRVHARLQRPEPEARARASTARPSSC